MKKYITTLLLCAAQFSTFRSALPLGSSKNFQLPLSAQCPVQNTAFQDGERLEYKLFFNWKFIWKTAGSATLTTRASTYQGRPAFQSDLITRTSGRIDRWFCMRDTLRSIVSTNIVPLYYHKASNEGGKNRFNRISLPLTGCAGHEHVMVGFELTTASTVDNLLFDNVRIIDQRQHDLKATIASMPHYLKVG